jgi:hypothetical protein
MAIKSNTPAPHAGETPAPAIPKDGKTPGMGAPPNEKAGKPKDREPGTRKDGEAMPPQTIDPALSHEPEDDADEAGDPVRKV